MEFRKQFQAERRKSMSIEEAIVRLQRDNKGKAGEVANLKREIAENKSEIKDLSDKVQKAQQIIEALGEENQSLRD